MTLGGQQDFEGSARQLGATYTSTGARFERIRLHAQRWCRHAWSWLVLHGSELTSGAQYSNNAATYGSLGSTESLSHPVLVGIEQTFHVTHKAHGAGPLTIDIPISGATAVTSGSGIDLRDGAGQVVATYTGLKVTDAAGKIVPASMGATAAGSNIKITVRDGAATYPLNIDPTWSNPSTDVYVVSGEGVQPVNLTTGAGTDETLSGGQMFIPPGSTTGWVTYYGNIGTSSTVRPINLLTGIVGTAIDLGSEYGVAWAMSPNGENIYATSNDDTSVAVFNTVTRVASTFIIGSGACDIECFGAVVSPNGETLWLAGYGSVTPVNLATNTVGTTIAIPDSAGYENSLVMSPDGGTLYATFGGNC